MTTEHKNDIIINAKDKSKTAFSSAQKGSDRLSKSIKQLASAAAGLFAFKKAKDFIIDATKAFGEQERAEAKLESIMKKVNNATDEQINAMKKQANELQKVTTVGDETTLALQAQLGTFALSQEAISTLTEQTLNLAVANKGVNVTQEDMINYGNLVGKVMTGQAGALTRYGVTLTEAQIQQIKMGDEMQRATVIAEVLRGNYGDLARDMKNTWEGQVQSFKNSWGDMKELLGEQLMPILIALVKWGTETGIPALIQSASWLKDRWENNFLGIQTIVKLTWKAVKVTFEAIVTYVEKMIDAWDRAIARYEKFKRVVGSVSINSLEEFQAANPAPNIDAIRNGTAQNFANGGMVQYAQSGGLFRSRGTDTIPAMLTPGELVLNEAQQNRLANRLSGQQINITINEPNFRDEAGQDSFLEKFKRTLQLELQGSY